MASVHFSDNSLSRRTIEVLCSIVQTYIETGEPVASREIARRRRDGLSAATIRNIMAELADHGFLDQPHTSAGRVPTALAFQVYAKQLETSRVLATEIARLREELSTFGTLEARAEHTTHLLTQLTSSMGIFATTPGAGQILDQVEFVPLPPQRVVMVVSTRDKMVRSQVVELEEPVSADELASIRNYVNHHFSGWTLGGIRRELERRFQLESSAYDSILLRLTMLYDKGLLDVGLTPQIYLEGAANLVAVDLNHTKQSLSDLLRALEEKKRLIALLDQFLESSGSALQVQVGLGEIHPAMQDLSLIGVNVELPGGLETKLAVIGPMRMNYPRVMSSVWHISQALRGLPPQ